VTSPEAQAVSGGVRLAEADRARVQKRTLAVVVASQILGGAGLAAGVTVGALLAQQMLGSDGLAGLPTALFTLGSALTAYLVGRFSSGGDGDSASVSVSPPAVSARSESWWPRC
jgi:hypothetical protein